MRVVRWVPGSLFLLGLAAVAPACERKAATEYIAGFSTQVQVPREFRTLEYSVYAYSADSPQGVMVECHKVEVIDGKARLPKTLGVNQEKTDAPNMMVTVVGYKQDLATVESFRGDCEQPVTIDKNNPNNAARILRKSRQAYRDGKILYLPMPLKYACFDVPCSNPEETCVGGRCAKVQRDQRVFKEYSPEAVFGDSSTCFSMKRCLSDATIPTVEDASTCTYSVPGTVEGMNVRVIFDGYVTEVLDVDPPPPPDADDALKADYLDHEEGYTNLGNGRFRLAKGLCDATKADSTAPHKILSVVASRACPAKSPNQPLCDEGAEVLIPAPSRLYVLLDRSQDMQELLGKKAIDQILGLSLDDPVFSTTEVGFHWLPSKDATACPDPAEYDKTKLDVPFLPTLQARDKIVEVIGTNNAAQAPAATSPFPALGDVTKGAYNALLALTDKDKLNRRAVMLITNGNVGNDCSGVPNAAMKNAAAAAVPLGVYTYVVALGRPNFTGDVPDRQARVQACKDLAGAGGTECFDATSGDDQTTGAVSANALNTIVADLSSCLYARPGSITEATKTKLSFLTTSGPKEVKFDAACGPNALNTDGWNFQDNGSLIRICGPSCQDLRNTVRDLANQAAIQFITTQKKADPQPIFVTATQEK